MCIRDSTVGDTRLADVDGNLEFAHEAINEDFKVQLAHAIEHGLAGLFVDLHLKGGVFFGQGAEGVTHLVLVDVAFGFDGELNDRLREVDGFQDNRPLGVAQGVAGEGVLQAQRGGDVAGAHFLQVFAVVSVCLLYTS